MAGRYFMVLVVDPITDTILLPRMFTDRSARKLESPVIIRSRDIDETLVQLDVLPDGEMWLAEGWKEFAAASAMESGFVLLFHFVGHSVFNVTIYRQCGLDNPHPNYPERVLPVNFFKTIANDGCLQQLDFPQQLNNLFLQNLPNPIFINPEEGPNLKVGWKIHNGVISLNKGWKEAAANLSIKLGDVVFFNYKGGKDIEATLCKNSEVQITTSFHRIIEGEVDMDQITIWIVKVSEYMLLKHKPLYIPAWVARKYFGNNPEEVDVRLPSGEVRKWSLIWSSRERNEVYLGHGWYSFVKDYKLKVKQRIRFYKEWNEEIINVEVLQPY